MEHSPPRTTLRQMFVEEEKHVEQIRLRAFEQFSQHEDMEMDVEDHNERMDEMARLDDLQRFRKTRLAGYFFDFEAEENDKESSANEDSLGNIFRRRY